MNLRFVVSSPTPLDLTAAYTSFWICVQRRARVDRAGACAVACRRRERLLVVEGDADLEDAEQEQQHHGDHERELDGGLAALGAPPHADACASSRIVTVCLSVPEATLSPKILMEYGAVTVAESGLPGDPAARVGERGAPVVRGARVPARALGRRDRVGLRLRGRQAVGDGLAGRGARGVCDADVVRERDAELEHGEQQGREHRRDEGELDHGLTTLVGAPLHGSHCRPSGGWLPSPFCGMAPPNG